MENVRAVAFVTSARPVEAERPNPAGSGHGLPTASGFWVPGVPSPEGADLADDALHGLMRGGMVTWMSRPRQECGAI